MTASRCVLLAAALTACVHYPATLEVGSGTYTVGCSDGLACSATPVRTVRVGAFALDSTLVTTFEYQDCVAEGACPPLIQKISSNKREVAIASARGAEAFCQAHGGRLPTSEEWEVAARGPDANVYPWGDTWSFDLVAGHRVQRWTRCLGSFYSVAGSRPDVHSAFGLEDTIGPGPEWVSADATHVALRGCGGFPSRQVEAADRCKLARVVDARSDSHAAFRCAYTP